MDTDETVALLPLVEGSNVGKADNEFIVLERTRLGFSRHGAAHPVIQRGLGRFPVARRR
jgi:hypothetical protein